MMPRSALLLAVSALAFGCSTSGSDTTAAAPRAPATTSPTTAAAGKPSPRLKADTPPKPGDAVAYYAGGCFWGVEHYLQQMDGVSSVESGYMGGSIDAPTYRQVSSKKSGHVETVRVYFDPKRVSYEQVTQRFFEIHDPTQADGQGPDIGPQYLSVVFYTSPEQKATARSLMGILSKRGYKVATKLEPAAKFWRAEEGHQDYYARNGSKPYCHARVDRFGTGAK